MRWRQALLAPHVLRWAVRAPRDTSTRWDRYWAAVTATGDGGDVLWDSSRPDEAQRYLDLLTAHVDPRLPVIDLGCGNGRFTRTMATRFPHVIGIDLSPAAVARAREETLVERIPRQRDSDNHPGHLEFRAADLTADDVGARLHDELGDANVFVRGVLHVLDIDARRRSAATIRAVTGTTGTVLIAETNYAGPLLGYLESLGGGPRGLPHPLARAIASGLPVPRPFGVDQLDQSFPQDHWDRLLVDADAAITAVPMHRSDAPETIPGLLAVLRPVSTPSAARP